MGLLELSTSSPLNTASLLSADEGATCPRKETEKITGWLQPSNLLLAENITVMGGGRGNKG